MGACRSCSLGNGDGFHPPQWQPVAFPTRSAGRSWLFFSPSDGDGGKNQSAARWTGWKSIQVPESSGMHHPAKRPEGGGGGHLAEPPPPPGTSGFWCLHLIPSPAPCHRHSPRGFGCKPWETRPSQQRPFPMGKKPQAFPDGCSWLLWGKREHPLATGKMSLPCVSAGDDEAI